MRGQLGERLFGAFNLAAKSMGMTTQEMNKALEQGQVLAKDLLPKITPMISEMANANGALATQLESARTAENRFIADASKAGDKLFRSGFEGGLKNLYGTLSEIFEDSGPQLEKLGRIFGDVFNAIAKGLKVLEPVMKFAIDNFYTLVGVKATHTLLSFKSTLERASWAMAASWARAFAPISLALVAIDELYSMMDDTKIGLIEKTYGKQINLLKGTTSDFVEKDGKFYTKDSSFEGFNDNKAALSPEEFAKLSDKEKSAEMNRVLNRGTSLLNAFRPVQGAEKMKHAGVPDFWNTTSGNVTNTYYNTFQNTQLDDIKRAIGSSNSVAQQPRGK